MLLRDLYRIFGLVFFFFKQKTAYEMRISDWSSDVCSSDLKMIDKGIVIEAIEEAIQRAARARYGAENDIRAKLDVQTGDLRLWRVVEVVETVEDYFKQVDLAAGQKLQKDAQLGDFIVDPLPAVDLGRIDAQSAKQVIFPKVREADRERQYEEFKDPASEIITGAVKSVEFGPIVVNLVRAAGIGRESS